MEKGDIRPSKFEVAALGMMVETLRCMKPVDGASIESGVGPAHMWTGVVDGHPDVELAEASGNVSLRCSSDSEFEIDHPAHVHSESGGVGCT